MHVEETYVQTNIGIARVELSIRLLLDGNNLHFLHTNDK